jgi:hypothetical protein
MSLQNWLESGWIVRHEPTPEEISDLLAVVDRDLRDAAVDGLSPDWKLGIAYNGALQLAILALAAEGFRPGRMRAHERAILSLRYTVVLDSPTVDLLDGVQRKRNISNYERAGAASSNEAAEVLAAAHKLREMILMWLREQHQDLTPE